MYLRGDGKEDKVNNPQMKWEDSVRLRPGPKVFHVQDKTIQ